MHIPCHIPMSLISFVYLNPLSHTSTDSDVGFLKSGLTPMPIKVCVLRQYASGFINNANEIRR